MHTNIKSLALAGFATLALGGCASLPEATYVTADGCGIAQWNKKWIAENVAHMSWTGPCKSGLAHGDGTHVVKFKDGKERRYVGKMEKGYIHGKGTYTKESGWKYEGDFLWAKLTSGKVYIANGRLLFEGLMMHAEKYNGQTIDYDHQRYKSGKLYYPDGSYLDDARFDGSAGIYTGISTIDPATGKGIIYGKYIKDGQTVARYVEGQRYDDDSSFAQARLGYYERLNARLKAENAAAWKVENERRERERQEGLAILSNTLNAAAAGKTGAERRQLALDSLNQSTSGSGGNTGAGASAGAGVRPGPGSSPGGAGKSGNPREFNVQVLTSCVTVNQLPTKLQWRQFEFVNNCSSAVIFYAGTYVNGEKHKYAGEAGTGSREGLAPGQRIKGEVGPRSGTVTMKVEWACPSRAAVQQQTGIKVTGVGWKPETRTCVAYRPHDPVGTAQ